MLLGAACRPSAAISSVDNQPPHATARERRPVTPRPLPGLRLDAVGRQSETTYLETWAPAPRPGAHYVVFDTTGVLAGVRVAGPRPDVTCDHCGELIGVELAWGTLREGRALALLVDSSQRAWRPRALDRNAADDPRSDAAVDVQRRIDLNQDDVADLEVVRRCGAYTPSGCFDRACVRECRDLRRVDDGATLSTTCQDVFPDLDDCVP